MLATFSAFMFHLRLRKFHGRMRGSLLQNDSYGHISKVQLKEHAEQNTLYSMLKYSSQFQFYLEEFTWFLPSSVIIIKQNYLNCSFARHSNIHRKKKNLASQGLSSD